MMSAASQCSGMSIWATRVGRSENSSGSMFYLWAPVTVPLFLEEDVQGRLGYSTRDQIYPQSSICNCVSFCRAVYSTSGSLPEDVRTSFLSDTAAVNGTCTPQASSLKIGPPPCSSKFPPPTSFEWGQSRRCHSFLQGVVPLATTVT